MAPNECTLLPLPIRSGSRPQPGMRSPQAGECEPTVRPAIAPCRAAPSPFVQPAFVTQMDMCKLTIRTGQIKRNRTACLARAAADLREAEFKTLRKINSDTMF